MPLDVNGVPLDVFGVSIDVRDESTSVVTVYACVESVDVCNV